MAFILNGQVIKEAGDYLSKGARRRIHSSMRVDLYQDLSNLMKYIDHPMSVGFDVFVEMLQSDEELLKKFVDRVKKY